MNLVIFSVICLSILFIILPINVFLGFLATLAGMKVIGLFLDDKPCKHPHK